MKREEIPNFGVLSGTRVLCAATVVAAPTIAGLMADWGADVIWLENLRGFDVTRLGASGGFIPEERRNMRTISMNIAVPEGREAFLDIIKEMDIFVESSKPGLYDKLGLSDEELWKVNPKLVILHISGYGQTVDPKWRGRASYDGIAQAHGGMLYCNGLPGDMHPMLYAVGDYYTVAIGLGAVLAAYVNALKTGKGDSIDVAQYECMVRLAGLPRIDEMNYGIKLDLENDRDQTGGTQAAHCYVCKDGNSIYTRVLGGGVTKSICQFFDLPYGSDIIPEGTANIEANTPAGDMLQAKLDEFFANHTAAEAEDILAGVGVPIAEVLSYENMIGHPLFESNQTLIELELLNGKKVHTPNALPRFKNNPGQVWRPGIPQGWDNDDILADLGYDETQIADLYEKKAVGKGMFGEIR